MSAAQPQLEFELEEPGDDAIADKVFEILRNLLQPDTDFSLNDAAEQITESLPEGGSYSTEVGSFLWTCYELAQQIPYNHPSMTKLITLVHTCLDSPRLVKGHEVRHFYTANNDSPFHVLMSLPGDRAHCYSKLAETLADCWNSEYSP
jgi:hypothetical protein